MIEAKVIADSVSQAGDRLTTMEVNMHRFVLAEFNTHRVFSRNSASSRAIPLHKNIDDILHNPAWPQVWATEQPGMSGGEELIELERMFAEDLFEDIRNTTVNMIQNYLHQCETRGYRVLHKSLLNRLIEPFKYHRVIVSSTEWDNFFEQRCHPAAQPEMRLAAEAMQRAYRTSIPVELEEGEWHLPYWHGDVDAASMEIAIPSSIACCARVSSLNHDKVKSIEDDIKLFEKLKNATPPHWSPMEHVATPETHFMKSTRNFKGWIQIRQVMEDQDRELKRNN